MTTLLPLLQLLSVIVDVILQYYLYYEACATSIGTVDWLGGAVVSTADSQQEGCG